MKPIAILLTLAALGALLVLPAAAAVGTVSQSQIKPKKPASHMVPMHPHSLTLYPYGKPKRAQPRYSYTRHRFDHPTPVHGTIGGPSTRAW